MSSPKFTRIVQAVADRCLTITEENGYYTNIGARVLLDLRQPQADELPCIMVFAGQRTVQETLNCAARTDMEIIILGYVERIDQPLILGDQVQSDIQRAVELEDETLGGLLRGQHGLAYASSEIFMPEVGANVVGARVTYSAPSVRLTGNPEIS